MELYTPSGLSRNNHAMQRYYSDSLAGHAAYGTTYRRLCLGGVPPQLIHHTASGGVRLLSTPPIRRTPMAPQPWTKKSHSLAEGGGALRRLLLAVLVVGQALLASRYLLTVLPFHGARMLERIELGLFILLFAWISAGFWTAIMGFAVILADRHRHARWRQRAQGHVMAAGSRTAVIMPICNENVARVFAGLRATYESMAQTGESARFDFFVLSDSNDADCRVAEQQSWLALCQAVGGFGRIFYRWRRHRIKHKSGNVADFCRRWGGNYQYVVVLDADSIMSGECLVQLMRLMEANDDVGIIQTAPRAVGRETPYARMQQFANRVYGPLFTAGLYFWQLGESHYWGHNAIIRLKPFMRYCALRRLPGRGALSGAILSHDFVEAALMRRAGWRVWIAFDLPGSYEEVPSNLNEELSRDRRWCQGNLMNFRLLLTQGLHPVHRTIFVIGALAYVSALLWLVSLILATTMLAQRIFELPIYYVEPYQLLPLWPEWHPERAVTLLMVTAALLYIPKMLGAALLCRRDAKAFGGWFRLLSSVLLEMLISMLLAPVRMLFHSYFVVAGLLGYRVRWLSPTRVDSEVTWRDAWARQGVCLLVGAAWAGCLYWLSPGYLWWYLPVVGALILAMPLSVVSSLTGLGRWLRDIGLFVIPEEAAPPLLLRQVVRYQQSGSGGADFRSAVSNAFSNAVSCSLATARLKQRNASIQDSLINMALTRGPKALENRDRSRLLDNPAALAQLHYLVHISAAAHPGWHEGRVERAQFQALPFSRVREVSASFPPVQ